MYASSSILLKVVKDVRTIGSVCLIKFIIQHVQRLWVKLKRDALDDLILNVNIIAYESLWWYFTHSAKSFTYIIANIQAHSSKFEFVFQLGTCQLKSTLK